MTDVVVVMVVMMVVAVVMMVVIMMVVVFGAEQPEDARRQSYDEQARDQNEPGLRFVVNQLVAKPQTKSRESPDDDRMAHGRRTAEQRGLGRRAARGDHEGRHHGFGMARLKRVKRAKQDGEGQVEPWTGGARLKGGGYVRHERARAAQCV